MARIKAWWAHTAPSSCLEIHQQGYREIVLEDFIVLSNGRKAPSQEEVTTEQPKEDKKQKDEEEKKEKKSKDDEEETIDPDDIPF